MAEVLEGILVASKIAEQAGITRSIIVTGLKKLESAGVIESKSAGMKGTKVRICNDMLLEELENMKNLYKLEHPEEFE